MIGEIRQNFTEASASVGLILATALIYTFSVTGFEKPKQHLIKVTVIAEVEMYNLYDYFYCLTIVTVLDIDCDILIKYRVSSDSSVDLLSGTVIVVVSDWCIMNLDHGWWINILLNLFLIYPPIK